MDVDGKNKRQITADFGNCLEPRYLAASSITPPDFEDRVRWILFSSDHGGTIEELSPEPARAIYAQNLEPVAGLGIITRRSTFNLSSDFSPLVLSDGRVVFSSRQPAARNPMGSRFPLLVTNWDGTGLNLFLESEEGGRLRIMASEMPDRTLVFVESEGKTREGEGKLARISLKRPLHSREVLSKDAGGFLFPNALPDGRLLVSYAAGDGPRAICLFDFAAGAPGRRLHQDRQWDDQAALAIVPRPEPQGLLSAVVDAESTADLHCINVYESDLPELANVQKGSVKTVRIVEGLPLPSSSSRKNSPGKEPVAGNVRLRILGELPVEADGSFYVRLPADTPFYLQLLDADGMAIQTLKSWIWVRRGTSRQCLGCHENKELAPENRVTDALVKLLRHSLLDPPESRRMGADFRNSVMPIIRARCWGCHAAGGAMRAPDLRETAAGDFRRAYENLVVSPAARVGTQEGYLSPGSARNSPIIRALVLGQGTGKHPPVTLSQAEKRVWLEWVDLGARWENQRGLRP